MNMLRKLGAGVAVAAVAATALTFGSYSSHAEWTPKKPVEVVIMAGKGGGAGFRDGMAGDAITQLCQVFAAPDRFRPGTGAVIDRRILWISTDKLEFRGNWVYGVSQSGCRHGDHERRAFQPRM